MIINKKVLVIGDLIIDSSKYGEAVGLPPFQVGNSEVGHMNLGELLVIRVSFGKLYD